MADRHDTGWHMNVIGRADYNRVDLALHLLKHPPEVVVLFDVRALLEGHARPPIVHVAQRDDVLTSYLLQVGRSPPPS